MPTTQETPDVIAVLRHDHQHVEELFKKVQDHARFRNRRKELADQVITELIQHMVAEEQYVYPIVRAATDGQAVVEHALAVDAEAEALMRQLEPLEPTDEVFDRTLIKLMALTRSHVADEESAVVSPSGRVLPCCRAERTRREGPGPQVGQTGPALPVGSRGTSGHPGRRPGPGPHRPASRGAGTPRC